MSNGPRQLTEATVILTRDYIKTNIAAALNTVRTYHADARVSTEIPKSYFIYAKPQGYELPAIFVMCDEFDFKIDEYQANFICAKPRVNVTVLLEDKDLESLTYKCWRYQSALHLILDEANIKSSDNKVQLKVAVYRMTFSDIYQRTDKGPPGSEFRREVVLQCEITHLENF